MRSEGSKGPEEVALYGRVWTQQGEMPSEESEQRSDKI